MHAIHYHALMHAGSPGSILGTPADAMPDAPPVVVAHPQFEGLAAAATEILGVGIFSLVTAAFVFGVSVGINITLLFLR